MWFAFSLCFVAVAQSLIWVQLFATSWTAACQASLSFTISKSLLKLISIESMMPSNHLILCHPLLLLPSIFPNIRVFSNEVALHIRWPKYWTFSISPSNEYSELISFRIDCFDLLVVQGTLKSLLQHHNYLLSIRMWEAFSECFWEILGSRSLACFVLRWLPGAWHPEDWIHLCWTNKNLASVLLGRQPPVKLFAWDINGFPLKYVFLFPSCQLASLVLCDQLLPQPQVWPRAFLLAVGRVWSAKPMAAAPVSALGQSSGDSALGLSWGLAPPAQEEDVKLWVLTVSPRCPWESDAQPPQLRRSTATAAPGGSRRPAVSKAGGSGASPCSRAGGSPAAQPWASSCGSRSGPASPDSPTPC